MGKDDALDALAAYLRARRSVGSGAAVQQIPAMMKNAPTLPDLVTVLDGFVGADSEGRGTRNGLGRGRLPRSWIRSSVAVTTRSARIDLTIKRDGTAIIGVEVKQVDTGEGTADTLAEDTARAQLNRALLAVLGRAGEPLGACSRTGACSRA